MLKTNLRYHIFVDIMIHFSGFFDEYKVKKNSIYLKQKSFVPPVSQTTRELVPD